MQLSWSAMQTFLACPRKYELGYIEKLEKIPGAGSRPMLLGTIFHAGIAEFLDGEENAMKRAVAAALVSLHEETEVDKTYWNYETSSYHTDETYYDMVNELHHLIPQLLEYHLPLIGIGTKYHVARIGDLFPAVINNHEPMIEYEIDTLSWRGFVDAVLIDIETGQQVAVDWKMRSSFPYDAVATVDGQLPFYAAVLNEMGANISKTIMWQFRSKVPKPAKINKNGLPSVAAQDTTWEYWCETLPPPLTPEKWEEMLRPKLKTAKDFQHPVAAEVTSWSSLTVMNVANATKASILSLMAAYEEGQTSPARLSTYGCQFCDFLSLCSTALKYGGDANEIIEHEYRKKGK